MSSGDKNTEELKSLVIHTLETNGVLGQLRAQLRANVYKAIDEDGQRLASGEPRAENKFMQLPRARLMIEIVAEFFDFYGFRHSRSVFLPETNMKTSELRSRSDIGHDVGLTRVLADVSLLEQLVVVVTTASEPRQIQDGWHSSASSTTASTPPPVSSVSHAFAAEAKSDSEVLQPGVENMDGSEGPRRYNNPSQSDFNAIPNGREQQEAPDAIVPNEESDEEEIYSHISKLYRFAANTWEERGTGEAKLLKHRKTGQVRFMMRQERTMKAISNHLVVGVPPYCDLLRTTDGDACWVWTAQDFAGDEMNVEKFAIKLGDREKAKTFYDNFEKAKQLNRKVEGTHRESVETKPSARVGAQGHLPPQRSAQNVSITNELSIGIGSGSGLEEGSIGVSGESFEEIQGDLLEYRNLNRRLARGSGRQSTDNVLGTTATSAPSALPSANDSARSQESGSPTSGRGQGTVSVHSAESMKASPKTKLEAVVDAPASPVSIAHSPASPASEKSESMARSPLHNSRSEDASLCESRSPSGSPHSNVSAARSQDLESEGSESLDLSGRPAAVTSVANVADARMVPTLAGRPDEDDESFEDDADDFEENSHSGYESSDAHSGGF